MSRRSWAGFYGDINVAVIEVSGIREDGALIPSTSIGNNKTWLDLADRVIVEVNRWQPAGLEGMHDVYYGTALPPNRVAIPLTRRNSASASRTCAAILKRSSPWS